MQNMTRHLGEKCSFTIHFGLFEFAIFLHIIHSVYIIMEWNSVFVCMDNLLIAFDIFDEHVTYEGAVLEQLRKVKVNRMCPTL